MPQQNELKLLQFTVDSFAKIDKSQPVVIVFPEGANYVLLEGEQAVGKTSVIKAFIAACGLEMPDNAINRKDNDRKLTFEFEKGEKHYRVSISKSRFELERLLDEKWSKLSSPKTELSEILGPIGISPMFLKEKKGKEQLEWLRNFYRLSDEEQSLETRIEKSLDEAYKLRTKTKKELSDVENDLKGNDYHRNRGSWEEKINAFEFVGLDEQIKKVQDNFKTYNDFANGVLVLETKIEEITKSSVDIIAEIKKLKIQIQERDQLLKDNVVLLESTNQRLLVGKSWILNNLSFKTDNDDLGLKVEEQSTMKKHQNSFEQMVSQDIKSNNLHTEFIRLQNLVDQYREQKKAFIKTITPDIEGLEVCVPDEEEKREGIFYNGMPPSFLSESEMWELYSLLLEKLGIRIILIENISSLGSGAVEIFNKFMAAGGYILASQMKRGENNLRIIIQNRIAGVE